MRRRRPAQSSVKKMTMTMWLLSYASSIVAPLIIVIIMPSSAAVVSKKAARGAFFLLFLSLSSPEHSVVEAAFTTSSPSKTSTTHNRHYHLHHATSTKSASPTYGNDAPYKEANYDPVAAAEYYKDRPIESFSRLTQIVGRSSGFIVDSILDAKFDREEEVSLSCSIVLYIAAWNSNCCA